MLRTEVPKPPSKSVDDLVQVIRTLPRQDRLRLLKQLIQDLIPENADAATTAEAQPLPPAPDADEPANLIRDAARHVRQMAVLAADERDEQIVDGLLQRHRAGRPRTAIKRTAT